MKRLLQLIMVLTIAFGHTACEGDEGPPGPAGVAGPTGPAGPAGPQGESGRAQVLEFPADFQVSDDGLYSIYVNFEENEIEVAESDVVLVYKFMGAYNDANDNPVLLWSPLPQIELLSGGRMLQYNFIQSFAEVLIFIDSQFDLATLTQEQRDALTKQQGFRIVIIPGDLLNGRTSAPPVDFKKYEEVAKFYDISEDDVKRISLK